jgi:hypothetical protein
VSVRRSLSPASTVSSRLAAAAGIGGAESATEQPETAGGPQPWPAVRHPPRARRQQPRVPGRTGLRPRPALVDRDVLRHVGFLFDAPTRRGDMLAGRRRSSER